jgi:hypothetical protein
MHTVRSVGCVQKERVCWRCYCVGGVWCCGALDGNTSVNVSGEREDAGQGQDRAEEGVKREKSKYVYARESGEENEKRKKFVRAARLHGDKSNMHTSQE